jgi:selenocysteine lyase/cysteine desulfurase
MSAASSIDESLLAEEFPQADDIIYLNHAGVAPWPARTARAVREFADENAARGASRYADWLKHEAQLRERLHAFINAPAAADIALLKNTSEALSVVAGGLDWRWGDNVVGTADEFPSNRMPWQAQRKWGVSWKGVSLGGADPEADLMAACDARTRVLAVSSVQYGSGFRLDLARLGGFCRERGILFCVDAIQSIGALRFDVQAVQADFVMADAHKWLLGPEGIALFYCREDLRPALELHQYGWHMAHEAGDFDTLEWRPAANATRFECGSMNMIGIHALSASLGLLEEIGMERIERQLLRMSDYLVEELAGIADVSLLTPREQARRAGIVTFAVAGADPARLQTELRGRGVICAARGGGVRFSPHFYTGTRRIDQALSILRSILP